MRLTDQCVLDQRTQAVGGLEWWEHAYATTCARWTREVQALEPERLQPRPFAVENDLHGVVELLLSAQAAEPAFDWPGAGQLRALLAAPEFDATRDARVWTDAGGSIVAFAALSAGRYLLWFTRPAARCDLVDALIVAWAAERARALAAPGVTVSIRAEARDPETQRLASLARHGFIAEPEASLRLMRRLDMPVGKSAAPAGYQIRPLRPQDMGLYLALASRLFPHAHRLPLTEGRRRALMDDASYTPALDLVVEAADGALVGLCHAALRPDERERLGRRAGWIELLGVAPGRRRAGLARALLRAGLLALADYGADSALLTVRADNTSARTLYAAEGFTPLFEERAYTLTLA